MKLINKWFKISNIIVLLVLVISLGTNFYQYKFNIQSYTEKENELRFRELEVQSQLIKFENCKKEIAWHKKDLKFQIAVIDAQIKEIDARDHLMTSQMIKTSNMEKKQMLINELHAYEKIIQEFNEEKQDLLNRVESLSF